MAQGWTGDPNKGKDTVLSHSLELLRNRDFPIFHWALNSEDMRLKPILVIVPPTGEVCLIRELIKQKASGDSEKPWDSDTV